MITIIITAYNVSKTIERAIKSCISQSFKDIEILIVNDKSTDNTEEIIKSFNDDRIVLINNQVNLGAGMSRRIGTKAAKGEYTIFLDGDDWFNDDILDTLYKLAKKYDADIVSSGARFVYDNKPSVIETFEKEELLTGLDAVKKKDIISRWLNNKLVRRTLWDVVDYSPRRYIEDTQTCFFLMFYSKKIVNTPYIGCNYYQHSESLCHQSNEFRNAIYRTLCAIDMCNFLKERVSVEDFEDSLNGFLIKFKELKKYKDSDEWERYGNEITEIMKFFLTNLDF